MWDIKGEDMTLNAHEIEWNESKWSLTVLQHPIEVGGRLMLT